MCFMIWILHEQYVDKVLRNRQKTNVKHSLEENLSLSGHKDF